jgi:ABC-type amino acid transport substrate-binding protein
MTGWNIQAPAGQSRGSKTLAWSALSLVVLIVMLLSMVQPSEAADQPEIKLASDTWPPFTDQDGKHRVAVEIVLTALERAGVQATSTIVDWKEVERGIQEGLFDGSAAMWRTDQRERDLLYSEPYLENRLVLIGRKGSDVQAKRINDLGGKRVAAVGRYAYGPEIDSAQGVFFVSGRNDQENLDKLLRGEVDYMLVDQLVALYLMTYQPEETAAKLEIGSIPLARRTLHFVLRRNMVGAVQIIGAFNRELRGMLTDGTFAQILQLGWIQVDVDGDGRDEVVALGDQIGLTAPGSVYDVFGTMPETDPQKQRFFVQGSIYEGWDSIPAQYKARGPSEPMDQSMAQGATLFTLQF